jgi:hypothetical protein
MYDVALYIATPRAVHPGYHGVVEGIDAGKASSGR